MKKEQLMVREFHTKARACIQNTPGVPDEQTCALREELIQEEFLELMQAFSAQDIVKVADAIGDLLYVVLGTAVSCGIDIKPVFDEIHRSNMTKFIDGKLSESGKYVKGPSYSPADIHSEIEHQMGFVE